MSTSHERAHSNDDSRGAHREDASPRPDGAPVASAGSAAAPSSTAQTALQTTAAIAGTAQFGVGAATSGDPSAALGSAAGATRVLESAGVGDQRALRTTSAAVDALRGTADGVLPTVPRPRVMAPPPQARTPAAPPAETPRAETQAAETPRAETPAAARTTSPLPAPPDPTLGTISSSGRFVPRTARAVPSAPTPAEARGDAGRGVASLLRGGGAPREARYRFSAGDASRLWQVVDVRVVESVNAPYEATMTLASDREDADADAMLGQSGELAWDIDGAEHRLCGIVARVEAGDAVERCVVTRVRLVPAFEALRYRVQSRIFQHKSVPDILAEVLHAGLRTHGRSARLSLQRGYHRREYVTQYEESDLDFVHRLCEEEGISYRFVHEDAAEEMVLFDANGALAPRDASDGGQVPYLWRETDHLVAAGVTAFELARRIGAQRVSALDYDWTEPRVVSGTARGAVDAAPVQEHRRALTIGDYATPRYQRNDARVQPDVRSEARNADLAVAHGRGTVAAFRAGGVFELTGHVRPELDGPYVLTRVEHRGRQPSVAALVSGAADAPTDGYANTFAAVPRAVPLRPARRTPKPRVQGVQTATVVGPGGEEIYTDEHGRIKCKFHWDAAPAAGDQASCWIRVAQAWAGQGWGFVFLPRVGMEVVVSFLEGDPDRPLVTGCVYNGSNTPQYALPGDKAKSFIRTQSTPGGDPGKYNELRFDDAAGQEEVFVHAQKDLNEVVEHDHTTTVHSNQTITVDVDQATTVTGNQTNAVTLNQTETVGGNQALTVAGNRTKTVAQSETITVNGTRTATVAGDETVTLLSNRTLGIKGEDFISVGGSRTITVAQDLTQVVSAGNRTELINSGNRDTFVKETDSIAAKNKTTIVDETYVNVATLAFKVIHKDSGLVMTENHIDLSAKDYLQLVSNSGQAAIRLAPDGKLTLMAREELALSCGAASLVLKKDGTIAVTGPTKVTVAAAGSTVELTPEAVATNGAKITTAAIGVHEIQGALIKIN